MIKENYVDFETAKLLKEKGFDIPCWCYYHKEKLEHYFREVCNKEWSTSGNISAPTQQMAMRWIREEKQIMLDSWALGGHSGYFIVIQDILSDFDEISPTEQVLFDTYEEACNAAINYYLDNLIK